jgi:hypothetical protein
LSIFKVNLKRLRGSSARLRALLEKMAQRSNNLKNIVASGIYELQHGIRVRGSHRKYQTFAYGGSSKNLKDLKDLCWDEVHRIVLFWYKYSRWIFSGGFVPIHLALSPNCLFRSSNRALSGDPATLWESCPQPSTLKSSNLNPLPFSLSPQPSNLNPNPSTLNT